MPRHKVANVPGERLPYAIVSVDKLIELAERVVKLEHDVHGLKRMNIEDKVFECMGDYIPTLEKGKLHLNAMDEEGNQREIIVSDITEVPAE